MVHAGAAPRGQNALGMELHATHIKGAVAQSHNGTIGRQRSDFQTRGQRVAIDHPRMVTPHDKRPGKSGKQTVVGHDSAFGGNTVVHFRQLSQLPAEDFGNGLVAETHTEQRDTPGGPTHHVEQAAGFARKSRSGGEEHAVVVIDRVEWYLIARNKMGHGPALAHQLYEIVHKGIVTIHHQHVARRPTWMLQPTLFGRSTCRFE